MLGASNGSNRNNTSSSIPRPTIGLSSSSGGNSSNSHKTDAVKEKESKGKRKIIYKLPF